MVLIWWCTGWCAYRMMYMMCLHDDMVTWWWAYTKMVTFPLKYLQIQVQLFWVITIVNTIRQATFRQEKHLVWMLWLILQHEKPASLGPEVLCWRTSQLHLNKLQSLQGSTIIPSLPIYSGKSAWTQTGQPSRHQVGVRIYSLHKEHTVESSQTAPAQGPPHETPHLKKKKLSSKLAPIRKIPLKCLPSLKWIKSGTSMFNIK